MRNIQYLFFIMLVTSTCFAQTTKPATQPTALSVADAEKLVDAALADAHVKMDQIPKYQALKKRFADAESKYNKQKASGKISKPVEAEYFRADDDVKKFESKWISDDQSVTDAYNTMYAVKKRDEDERNKPEFVTIGETLICVAKPTIDTVSLETIGGKSESKDELLQFILIIKNRSDDKKLNYKLWRSSFEIDATPARLRDDIGNTYKRIRFNIGSKPAGTCDENASIYPGKTINEILAFEPPVKNAKKLTLTLPNKNIGEQGETEVEFDVPAQK